VRAIRPDLDLPFALGDLQRGCTKGARRHWPEKALRAEIEDDEKPLGGASWGRRA